MSAVSELLRGVHRLADHIGGLVGCLQHYGSLRLSQRISLVLHLLELLQKLAVVCVEDGLVGLFLYGIQPGLRLSRCLPDLVDGFCRCLGRAGDSIVESCLNINDNLVCPQQSSLPSFLFDTKFWIFTGVSPFSKARRVDARIKARSPSGTGSFRDRRPIRTPGSIP